MQVLFEGQDVWSDAKLTRRLRFHVGLVFQYPEYQLFEETVFQDIAFGPKNMGLSEDEVRARVLRAAGFVGIGDRSNISVFWSIPGKHGRHRRHIRRHRLGHRR